MNKEVNPFSTNFVYNNKTINLKLNPKQNVSDHRKDALKLKVLSKMKDCKRTNKSGNYFNTDSKKPNYLYSVSLF